MSLHHSRGRLTTWKSAPSTMMGGIPNSWEKKSTSLLSARMTFSQSWRKVWSGSCSLMDLQKAQYCVNFAPSSPSRPGASSLGHPLARSRRHPCYLCLAPAEPPKLHHLPGSSHDELHEENASSKCGCTLGHIPRKHAGAVHPSLLEEPNVLLRYLRSSSEESPHQTWWIVRMSPVSS